MNTATQVKHEEKDKYCSATDLAALPYFSFTSSFTCVAVFMPDSSYTLSRIYLWLDISVNAYIMGA